MHLITSATVDSADLGSGTAAVIIDCSAVPAVPAELLTDIRPSLDACGMHGTCPDYPPDSVA